MPHYRHLSHAGNHGDVLKHAVLCLIVEQLLARANPFVYIDTHAGAGLYDLWAPAAQKNREFETGILRLWHHNDLPAGLHTYIDIVYKMNPFGELRWYPGSPALVGQLMRAQDNAHLFDVHSSEINTLQNLFNSTHNVHVTHADGPLSLNTLSLPQQHQVLVLIDPSYKTRADFVFGSNALKVAQGRFAEGVFMLWYPVIDRGEIRRLELDVCSSGLGNILMAELNVAADDTSEKTRAMTGSGMIVINPPVNLKENLQQILPCLARRCIARRFTPASHIENPGTWRLSSLVSENMAP